MGRRIVIASTPEGLRAAATLARSGHEVRVLSPELARGGLPGVPDGLGATAVPVPFLGDTAVVEHASHGLLLGGRVHPTPSSRRALLGVLGSRGPAAAVGVVRARTRARAGGALAMGPEERSYAAWVANRVGRPAYEALFAPWATKRFGTDPEQVTAWLAWWVHGREAPARWHAPTRSAAQLDAWQRDAVLDAGGDVVEHAPVVGIELDGGRAIAVETQVGREHVDGPLYTDLSPAAVASLLPAGAVDNAWRFDLGRIHAAHRVQVTLFGEVDTLPWVTDVIDSERPMWRLTRPGVLPGEGDLADAVTAHLSLADDASLWRSDDAALANAVADALRDVVRLGGEPIVERWPGAVPHHALETAPRLARVLERYDRIGIIGAGARGAHRHLDLALEAGLLERVEREAQREAHRILFERPVRLPPTLSMRTAFGP